MLIVPLIMTVVIEGAVLFLLRQRESVFYLYWTALTSLTNVILNLCLGLVAFDSMLKYWLAVLVGELLVFLAELLLCYLYTKDLKISAKYSMLCNATSFGIGLLIFEIILK